METGNSIRTAVASVTSSRLQIAVDARPFAGSPCGYTVYLASVLHCLRSQDDIDLILLSNRTLNPAFDELSGLRTLVFGVDGDLKWEQTDLSSHIAKQGYQVFFAGANRGISIYKARKTRYILGLLDVIPYIFYKEYLLGNMRTWATTPHRFKETISQLISIIRADAILTISEQSAIDIRRVFWRRNVTACPIRLRDVRPIPSSETRRQFVYVGGVDARKKVDVLLHGFSLFARKHTDYKLVLIGANYASLLPLINALGLADRVELTGYISHDAKFARLAESVAMVYPSLYEGYGLAIAEGFQAGIPVIAGHGGAQAEIGGSATRSIDPRFPEEVAAAMEEMLDADTRAHWIACGREQLARLASPAIEQRLVAFFRNQALQALQTR